MEPHPRRTRADPLHLRIPMGLTGQDLMALVLPLGDLVRYTINSTSVTLTDPDAAPRLGREALLALARWMAQGDERSGSSRSTPVDGPSERATGSDPRGAAPDGVAQGPAGTALPGGGR